MVPAEVLEAVEAELVFPIEGVDPATCRNEQNLFCVGELIPLPIEGVASSLDRSTDIEVLDEAGTTVGTICFTTRLRGVTPESMTAWQYAAYLCDAQPTDLGQPYDFASDYIVVDANFVGQYLDKYWDGAPIWGGITHAPMPARQIPIRAPYCRVSPILTLPTPFHKQAFNRFIEATNAFDRFLKLYHSVELLFDFALMRQMQAVEDDLVGFQKLISSYSSKEVERLKHLIDTFCDDPSALAVKIALVSRFTEKADEVFFEHTKDGNPLKAEAAWTRFKALASAGQLSEADVRSAKELGDKRSNYKDFVSSLAAYFIYRVRSSIAHHRVGEFIFVDTDEAFVAEFAEPLMLEVVRQVLSGQKMSDIV